MVVDTASHRSRLPDEKGRDGQLLSYVEFLEVAPWNRPEHVQMSKFRGVGLALINVAIQLSVDEGFKGRMGLHSLPQSEDFYRKVVGMHDHGADAGYPAKLCYFELTEVNALAFVKGGKR